MSHRHFFSTAVLILLCISSYAQISNFWPRFNAQKASTVTGTSSLLAEGCVDGNCLSGQGTYVTVKKWATDSVAHMVEYCYYISKGEFSGEGGYFKGKTYRCLVTVPETGATTDDDISARLNSMKLVFDGNMASADRNYVHLDPRNTRYYPFGDMQYAIIPTYGDDQPVAGYFNKEPKYLYFAPKADTAVKWITGMTNQMGYILIGEAVTSQGYYRGTFYHNKPDGFGTMATPRDDKKVWFRNGVMTVTTKPVCAIDTSVLLKIIKSVTADREQSYRIFLTRVLKDDVMEGNYITGKFYNQWGDQSARASTGPGLLLAKGYFYVGMFNNGKAHGAGSEYYTWPYQKNRPDTGMADAIYTGIYDEGYFKEGQAIGHNFVLSRSKDLHRLPVVTEVPYNVQFNLAAEKELAMGFTALAGKDCSAFNHFKAAAEKGNMAAAYRLGMIYNRGYSDMNYFGCVEENATRAVYWLDSAARRGNREALGQLSYIFRYGKGSVQQDTLRSRMYALQAIAMGDTVEAIVLANNDKLYADKRASAETSSRQMYERSLREVPWHNAHVLKKQNVN